MDKVKTSHLNRIRDARTEMSRLVEKISKVQDELNALIAQFEEQANLAYETVDIICADIQDFMDSKSERWHESDRATAFQTWLDTWQDVATELSGFELEESQIDINDLHEFIDNLDPDRLPERPEE